MGRWQRSRLALAKVFGRRDITRLIASLNGDTKIGPAGLLFLTLKALAGASSRSFGFLNGLTHRGAQGSVILLKALTKERFKLRRTQTLDDFWF